LGCGFDSRQSHMESVLYLYVPVAWLVGQLIKGLLGVLKYRRFVPTSFFSRGGMPSSHSALVSALVTAVGINEGVTSTMFVVTLVFSFIVIYDAWAHHRVRRHTLPQVLAGIVVGVVTIFTAAFLHGYLF
jgi:acid phosphatase family membrane protein YuiD